MSSLHLTSSLVSRFAYIFDDILCGKVCNPIAWSLAAVCLGSAITIRLIMATSVNFKAGELNLHDTCLHLIHNVVDLTFITRFPSNDKEGLAKNRNIVTEGLFLVAQHVGLLFLYFTLNLTFLSGEYNIVFRLFMFCQIICPYAILFLSLSEKYFTVNKLDEKDSLNTLQASTILVETNNNLLPIFITNSFAFIRLTYPFVDAPVLLALNKFACFSIKLALIHRFILHDIIVLYGENPTDYAKLYRPVTLNDKRTVKDIVRPYETLILLTCTVILIIQEVFISLIKIL